MHKVYNWNLRRSGRGIRVFGDIHWDGSANPSKGAKLPTVDAIDMQTSGVIIASIGGSPVAQLMPIRVQD